MLSIEGAIKADGGYVSSCCPRFGEKDHFARLKWTKGKNFIENYKVNLDQFLIAHISKQNPAQQAVASVNPKEGPHATLIADGFFFISDGKANFEEQ